MLSNNIIDECLSDVCLSDARGGGGSEEEVRRGGRGGEEEERTGKD